MKDFRNAAISKLGGKLPGPLKRAAILCLNRYRCLRADRKSKIRDRPSISCDSDSPDQIVCVVVDALRADEVGESAAFLGEVGGGDAVAPASWTFPSVTSILTGLYPHEHGVIRQNDSPDIASEDEITLPPELDREVNTLPDYLSGAGYETYGAFAFRMPFLAAKGYFDTHRLYTKARAERVLTDYLDWQANHSGSKTFAYLHLFDPHMPFGTTPPASYWEAHKVDRSIEGIESWRYTKDWDAEGSEYYQEHRKRLYQAAVDYVDDQLRSFTNELLERDASSVIIYAGDHGEAFWEHAQFDTEHFYDSRPAYCVAHGGTPYEPIARVPIRGKNIIFEEGPTSLIDIMPTVLNRVGIDPSNVSGRVHGTGIEEDRVLLIESARYGYEKKAAYSGDWKLLVSLGDDQAIGYELPEETATKLPAEIRAELYEKLPEWPEDGVNQRVSVSVQNRLENLGYK